MFWVWKNQTTCHPSIQQKLFQKTKTQIGDRIQSPALVGIPPSHLSLPATFPTSSLTHTSTHPPTHQDQKLARMSFQGVGVVVVAVAKPKTHQSIGCILSSIFVFIFVDFCEAFLAFCFGLVWMFGFCLGFGFEAEAAGGWVWFSKPKKHTRASAAFCIHFLWGFFKFMFWVGLGFWILPWFWFGSGSGRRLGLVFQTQKHTRAWAAFCFPFFLDSCELFLDFCFGLVWILVFALILDWRRERWCRAGFGS